MRIRVFRGLYWGPLTLGKYHTWTCRKRCKAKPSHMPDTSKEHPEVCLELWLLGLASSLGYI